MSDDASKKFVNHYNVISVEEGVRKQEQMQADKLGEEIKEEPEKVVDEIKLESHTTADPVQNEDSVTESDKTPAKQTPKGSQKNSAPSSPKRKLSRQSSSSQHQLPVKSVEDIQPKIVEKTAQSESENTECQPNQALQQSATDSTPQN